MEERRVSGEGGGEGGEGGAFQKVLHLSVAILAQEIQRVPHVSVCIRSNFWLPRYGVVLIAAVLELRRPRSLVLHHEHVTALRQSALLRSGGDALPDDGTRVGRHPLGVSAPLCFPGAAAMSARVLGHVSTVHVVGSRSGPHCVRIL